MTTNNKTALQRSRSTNGMNNAVCWSRQTTIMSSGMTSQQRARSTTRGLSRRQMKSRAASDRLATSGKAFQHRLALNREAHGQTSPGEQPVERI